MPLVLDVMPLPSRYRVDSKTFGGERLYIVRESENNRDLCCTSDERDAVTICIALNLFANIQSTTIPLYLLGRPQGRLLN